MAFLEARIGVWSHRFTQSSDAMDELLADVRRTLQRAGFDLISDKDADGLRVRRAADVVVGTWGPVRRRTRPST